MALRYIEKKSVTALVATVVFVLTQLAGASWARSKKDEQDKKNYTVSPKEYRRLQKAHDLLSAKKYKEALSVLDSMKQKRRISDYGRALMWQTYGYIYSSQEKYTQSIQAFEKCLSLNALPKAAALDTQFNTGQLYLTNKNYKKAVEVLVDWLNNVEKPTPSAKYMLAMAFMQTKQYRQALNYAKQAVSGVKKPKEGWLQLLLAVHFELKQYKEIARVLKKIINLYPKKKYWTQLYSVYMEIKQDRNALAVMELAYKQNFLTKHSELTNLASLYLHLENPYRAAKVLEKGIADGIVKRDRRSLEMLATSWLRAKELKQAISPMTSAAKLSPNGNLFVQVAHIYIEQEKWSNASKTLQQALNKGKLTDAGNAYLLLGISLYNIKKYDAARKAFKKASDYKNTKKPARQWLKLLLKKR